MEKRYLKKNYHTHTTRCKHAYGEDRAYVEAAIAQGMETLGFSDHIPMPTEDEAMNSIRMRFSELDDYMHSILSLKEEYQSDIQILVGFEGEYVPSVYEEQMRLLEPYPYDYILLGQHFDAIDGPYAGTPSVEESRMVAYVDHCMEGLSTGNYAYLAHPDLIHYTGMDKVWNREMRRLLSFCKEKEIPVEFNLLGLLTGRHYPCKTFLQLAQEVENEVIIGIDAHTPEHIGNENAYAYAQAMIEQYHLQETDVIKLRSH